MDPSEEGRVRLAALRYFVQFCKDVMRYNDLLQGDRVIRSVEIGTGKDRVKLTQIEQALRLAAQTTTQSRRLLDELQDFHSTPNPDLTQTTEDDDVSETSDETSDETPT
jgi:hypothetical protein